MKTIWLPLNFDRFMSLLSGWGNSNLTENFLTFSGPRSGKQVTKPSPMGNSPRVYLGKTFFIKQVAQVIRLKRYGEEPEFEADDLTTGVPLILFASCMIAVQLNLLALQNGLNDHFRLTCCEQA